MHSQTINGVRHEFFNVEKPEDVKFIMNFSFGDFHYVGWDTSEWDFSNYSHLTAIFQNQIQMNATNWWYNLTWQQRCEYREQMHVDIMTAEMIDKLFENKLCREIEWVCLLSNIESYCFH